MKFNQFALAAVATLLVGGSLIAQPPGQKQDIKPVKEGHVLQETSGRQTFAGNTQSKDQVLAHCLAITNQEQVLLASYAKDKASHDDVKAFATMLEQEHQDCLENLKEMTSQAASARDAAAKRDAANDRDSVKDRDNANNRDQETNREKLLDRDAVKTSSIVAGNNSSSVDFVQLHQEMSEQCLKDTKEMLDKKEGQEFDKCFVSMQVAKHAAMHSQLTVLQRHTSGELQSLIKESLAKNDKHLKASIDLMKKLETNVSTNNTNKSK